MIALKIKKWTDRRAIHQEYSVTEASSPQSLEIEPEASVQQAARTEN